MAYTSGRSLFTRTVHEARPPSSEEGGVTRDGPSQRAARGRQAGMLRVQKYVAARCQRALCIVAARAVRQACAAAALVSSCDVCVA